MKVTIDASKVASLEAGLRKQWPRLIVLLVNEPLASDRCAHLIRKLALEKGFLEREVYVGAAKGFDWKGWLAELGSASLFSAQKRVELRLPSGKPGPEGAQALTTLCHALPPDVALLVTMPSPDWSTAKTSWYQALLASAYVIETTAPSRAQLPSWVAHELGQQNQSADTNTLEWLAQRFEGNLLAGAQELAKLALLLPSGPLSWEAVQAAVLDVARWDANQLTEAILNGQASRCIRILEGLRAEGEPVPKLLWLLAEELRMVLRAQQYLAQGLDSASVQRELRGPRERIQRALRAAQRLPNHQIVEALQQTSNIDKMTKGVMPGNDWRALKSVALSIASPTSFSWTFP